MRFLIFVFCLFALLACSDDGASNSKLADVVDTGANASNKVGEDDAGADADATADDDANPDDDAGEFDEECVCSGVSACCDGCDAVNVGDECDDGLSCTLGTTCQAGGTCGGAVASPCDELIDSPECKVAICDEVAGCSFQNVHEGFRCDDGDDRTVEDRCVRGECVGTPCECDEGECCDGCWFLPVDTVCESGEERETCDEHDACGASRIRQVEQRLCSGDSGACDAPKEWVTVEVVEECRGTYICMSRHGSTMCYPGGYECI